MTKVSNHDHQLQHASPQSALSIYFKSCSACTDSHNHNNKASLSMEPLPVKKKHHQEVCDVFYKTSSKLRRAQNYGTDKVSFIKGCSWGCPFKGFPLYIMQLTACFVQYSLILDGNY